MDINYDHLSILERDMLRILNDEPALSVILRGHINRFFSLNRPRLDILHKTMAKIQKRFIEHDHEGNPVTTKKEDGSQDFVFLSSPKDDNGLAMIGVDARAAYAEVASKFLTITFKLLL